MSIKIVPQLLLFHISCSTIHFLHNYVHYPWKAFQKIRFKQSRSPKTDCFPWNWPVDWCSSGILVFIYCDNLAGSYTCPPFPITWELGYVPCAFKPRHHMALACKCDGSKSKKVGSAFWFLFGCPPSWWPSFSIKAMVRP